MQHFHNILVVSHGITDETEALKQGLSLARNNKAALKVLIVCPELPKEMAEYKDRYETSLMDELQRSISKAREAVHINETIVPVQIEMESGGARAIGIIRRVLKEAHDLVLKEAEPQDGSKGFKALDMELLRKCPCPVWLCRPINRHRNDIKVAVAIDPENRAPEGHDLSLHLLELARALADTCNGELNIVSCWGHDIEQYVRPNIRNRLSADEWNMIVADNQAEHRAKLDALIGKSRISGNLQIHHLQGRADKMIPKFIDDASVDILVMGTLARTGIESFIIGNTAENILQKVGCSLLAAKPVGFVSPVKAY